MTVTEALIASVDTFCESPGGCKACFFIIFFAWFFHTLSYGSDVWAEISEGSVDANIGLWNHCSKSATSPDFTCCETVGNFLGYHGRRIPAWLHASRFFQSVGLLTSMASVVFSILCTFVSPTVNKKGVRITAAVLNFLAAGGILIGVSIYGGQYRYESWMKSYFPSWSFAFSVISGIFYLVTGFVYLFAHPHSVHPNSQQGQNQPPPNTQRTQPTAPPMESFHGTRPNHSHPTSGVLSSQEPPQSGTRPAQDSGNNAPRSSDDEICCICLDSPSEILFLPCRHQRCCESCAESVQLCPICRRSITEKIKPYR
ncbi:uncharacterized protein LOC133206268 [Saccostrea echinata]|uniref:uncharacterized protein LOC133206268 n=1 Tax=Saccostrea echinata TaxID=191078 RepID=UPI002A823BE7|nr:uncharacterized protein LOC133206268 [Saccostrea echinata]